MRLDVVIPTYNRAALLLKTLRSLEAAAIPEGLEVTVYPVDNASRDTTRQTIEAFAATTPLNVRYVHESTQGRSAALNGGIRSGTGDLVAMIDDDEQVDPQWFATIHKWMSRDDLDYIGGPYIPDWEVAPPDWLPEEYDGVIGRCDRIKTPMAFGSEYPGLPMGGNVVIRRRVLDRVGPYAVELGRTGKGLLSCEDQDMFTRLQGAGARGMYVPELVIYHLIPAHRMTRRYYRDWCFGRAISLARIDAVRPEPVTYLLGIPRFLFGDAVRATWDSVRQTVLFNGSSARRFGNELKWWHLAGWWHGSRLVRKQKKA